MSPSERSTYPTRSSRSCPSTSACTLQRVSRTRWLFDEGGRPWHDNLVDYRWRSTRTDAEVAYKLHELRHYFASGPHRRRVRRGHRPAGDGPRVSNDDAEHLRASVADRGGQDSCCCVRDRIGRSRNPGATREGEGTLTFTSVSPVSTALVGNTWDVDSAKLIEATIASALKPRGYRKRGRNWFRPPPRRTSTRSSTCRSHRGAAGIATSTLGGTGPSHPESSARTTRARSI